MYSLPRVPSVCTRCDSKRWLIEAYSSRKENPRMNSMSLWCRAWINSQWRQRINEVVASNNNSSINITTVRRLLRNLKFVVQRAMIQCRYFWFLAFKYISPPMYSRTFIRASCGTRVASFFTIIPRKQNFNRNAQTTSRHTLRSFKFSPWTNGCVRGFPRRQKYHRWHVKRNFYSDG